ncbi:MAG: TonB-dependent receptor [Parerythrobacter sp.]
MTYRGHLTATLSTLALMTPALASAQTAPVQQDNDDKDVIIITGTAGGAGVSQQDAAFAVTNIDDDAIDQLAPNSTADVLSLVPGISVETSGGQSGANIFVRGFPGNGDAQFVTFAYEGAPAFPPPTLSFLENSQLFRLDETIARVEAVRGGPAQVLSNGQVGLTVNLVTRKGGPELEGVVGASITDYGDKRVDAAVSGPLGPDTGFAVGGFYRAGDGIRDAQFTAEKGGQISANVSHDFGAGDVLVYGRYLNDSGAWLLPIPVVQDADGGFSEFPGFDRGTGTFNSRETRLTTPNDGVPIDQSEGRGADLVNVGINLNYDIGDSVSLFSRTSYLDGSADTRGLVPNAAPQTLGALAAGFGSTIGNATFQSGGAVAAATQVIEVGAWRVDKDIDAFTTDNGLTFTSGANSLTAGVYYASYGSNDRWSLGNFLLLEAVSNPRIIDLTLADGRPVTRDGFTRGSFFNVNADYEGESIALYLSDTYEVNDRLTLDAGIRWERQTVDAVLENNDFGVDLDNNPDTLFNNGDAVLNGTFSTIDFDDDAFSWTIGGNYAITPDVGVFARYSRGNSFPQFDNLRDGQTVTAEIDTYEVGLKVTQDFAQLYSTVFYNEFRGLQSSQIVNGAPITQNGGANTLGFELEGRVQPTDGLNLGATVTYLDGEFDDFFIGGGLIDASGNALQRQPEWRVRGNASYTAQLGTAELTFYGSADFVDDRFSDIANQQILPSYTKVDAGILLELNERFEVRASADNLFDSAGLTEGNPRVIGGQGVGPIIARPILGRSFTFSTRYKF